jgi:REP-associated tyrosine transposase
MKERSPYEPIGRRALPHQPPHFIGTTEAIFFVTVCCRPRNINHLCKPDTPGILFDAARFYEGLNEWHIRLLLLMPDHVHFLVRFSTETGIRRMVQKWKRYTATKAGVDWQRDFFDHRLRSDESLDEKAAYIRANPVRAGLVARSCVRQFQQIGDGFVGIFGCCCKAKASVSEP